MKRKWLRKLIVIVVFLYVLSYFGLSRYSRYIHRELYSNPNSQFEFYYVPVLEEVILLEHPKVLGRLHEVLVALYYPVWLLDYYVLKGDHYAQSAPLIEYELKQNKENRELQDDLGRER